MALYCPKFKYLSTSDILTHPDDYIDTVVTIIGRLSKLSVQKKRIFGAIVDGSESTGLQLILTRKAEDEAFDAMASASIGSSIKVKGTIIISPGSGQSVELSVLEFNVISKLEKTDSYQYGSTMHKSSKVASERQHKWKTRLQDIRKDTYGRFQDKVFQAIMRIRSRSELALMQFFIDQGMIRIDTPLLTKSDCEGAGETFQVTTLKLTKSGSDNDAVSKGGITVNYTEDFFKTSAYLTVSGQLEAEAAAREFTKGVFIFGPTFRAEQSHTSRHLAEFWMLEPELCLESFSQLMDLEESMVRCVIMYLFEHCLVDLTFLDKTSSAGLIDSLKKITESDFKRITYTKAIQILTDAEFKDKPDSIYWGMDLPSVCERYICEKHFDMCPVFVTSYPAKLKSFYMKTDVVTIGTDKETCQAVDLLIPGIGELCGGSMREDDHDKLIRRMAEKSVPLDELKWYTDLRKEGGHATGGFGLGFERFVMLVTGISHIRDTIPFPKYPGHL